MQPSSAEAAEYKVVNTYCDNSASSRTYDGVTFSTSFSKSGYRAMTATKNGSTKTLYSGYYHLYLTPSMGYIRRHRVDVDIIFVTISKEHVFDGYTYQAFSYLLKPIDEERFEGELQRYLERKKNTSHCLQVSTNGKNVQIFLNRVLYFESDGRKVYVRERGERKDNDETISFYAKLNDVQEILKGEDFRRCHQSYLVNMKYVESYTRTELDVGGDSIPLSRKYISSIYDYFKDSRAGERSRNGESNDL